MAKSPQENFDLNNAFYIHLFEFYKQNKGLIKNNYKKLSKIFLDYNDPKKPNSFLRVPQYEALEVYIFLKEFLHNKPVYQLFEDWFAAKGQFGERAMTSLDVQSDLFWELSEKQYKNIFKKMKMSNSGRIYPNYIFALTMGTGKTILMATCIYYDFLLANKFPKDDRFIHNALVFAPDKTVLQSLRELETFDYSKVVPAEYLNVLTLKFHFLEDSGVTLNTLDGSRFNIVVSNSQKIILKRKNKSPTAADQLFSASKSLYKSDEISQKMAKVLGLENINDAVEDEDDLLTNQRFEKLRNLQSLGVFVDEAHHAFGVNLAKDMGAKDDKRVTSLRNTIDKLALSLKSRGTQVVGCYNYTGTPYVGKEVLPEVVYSYGLKEAIKNNYLKNIDINAYSNTRESEFLEIAISDFIQKTKDLKPEGKLPKMAIFGTTVAEVTDKIKPTVEEVLIKLGISPSKILVNVGDPKVTTNDQIREFNNLDSPKSEKQFVLLVNKGREGWNCRSLFSVALYRSPKSKIFVLQASMRCLRAIGDIQHTASVYLSKENMGILEEELDKNFRISSSELQETGKNKRRVKIKPIKPIESIKLKRIKRKFNLKEKELIKGESLNLDSIDLSKYRIIHEKMSGLDLEEYENRPYESNEITYIKEQFEFTEYNLIAEISRYLNKPCLRIQKVLDMVAEDTQEILNLINQFNEVLYDHIIPRLFSMQFEIETEQEEEVYDVALVKEPPIFPGYYEMSAAEDMIVSADDDRTISYKSNSFHLDNYCFDSIPERDFFWHVLQAKKVNKIWFTGMLTHGQSDFYIQYVDPDTHRVRSYYPDFLIRKNDGSLVMVEIKGEHMIEDATVKAKKEYAEMIAKASDIPMSYEIIPSIQAKDGTFDRRSIF